jgi:hypothetical protein
MKKIFLEIDTTLYIFTEEKALICLQIDTFE